MLRWRRMEQAMTPKRGIFTSGRLISYSPIVIRRFPSFATFCADVATAVYVSFRYVYPALTHCSLVPHPNIRDVILQAITPHTCTRGRLRRRREGRGTCDWKVCGRCPCTPRVINDCNVAVCEQEEPAALSPSHSIQAVGARDCQVLVLALIHACYRHRLPLMNACMQAPCTMHTQPSTLLKTKTSAIFSPGTYSHNRYACHIH